MIKIFKDKFENIAVIDVTDCPAYKDGPMQTHFRLSCYASYSDNYLYHVSCYETMDEALSKLEKFSNNSFVEIMELKLIESKGKYIMCTYRNYCTSQAYYDNGIPFTHCPDLWSYNEALRWIVDNFNKIY